MKKLFVIPGYCDSLGGTTVSLSTMIQGFRKCNLIKQLCVFVKTDSLMHQYLQEAGQTDCIKLISATSQPLFIKHSLQSLEKYPQDWPLLLENCVARELWPTLIWEGPKLRFSGRPTYHVFRDLARSYNWAGNLLRRITFASLSPNIICNSNYTAKAISYLSNKVPNVLYPPVDLEQFKHLNSSYAPPKPLIHILESKTRLLLTPSRITLPGKIHDKNLRSLIKVLAHLKHLGHKYHLAIIGEDMSPRQGESQFLLREAARLGVSEHFSILSPSVSIQRYYSYADAVITLAPREPFGRIVVEAIACGIPVIGSRNGGIGEILSNFAPEWTVTPFNTLDAAKLILTVTNDSNTQSITEKGKAWVKENCNPISYAKRIASVTKII